MKIPIMHWRNANISEIIVTVVYDNRDTATYFLNHMLTHKEAVLKQLGCLYAEIAEDEFPEILEDFEEELFAFFDDIRRFKNECRRLKADSGRQPQWKTVPNSERSVTPTKPVITSNEQSRSEFSPPNSE